MEIGDRIKSIRQKNKDSQIDLSIKLNKTQNAISSMERKSNNLTIETLIKICEIYNVSADYILFGKGTMNDNEKEKEILEIFRQLNADYKAVAKYQIMQVLNKLLEEQNTK